tara:strand:- start:1247 stop:1933 length:687 start_codon:yes stop_codon:yes gene_type:complete
MITVITVHKDNTKGLEKTLKSLSCLSYLPDRVIVIDGLSKEIPTGIIKSNAKVLNIDFISGEDNGIYDAMNKGRKLISKGLVHYLNSGDIVTGEPYDYSHALPYRLKVNVMSKNQSLLDIPLKKDGTFCHQGILFPFNHIPYNIKYEISADFEVMLDTFSMGISAIPKNQSGGIVFDLSGISSTRPFQRDTESLKILLKKKKWHLLFFFLLGRITSLLNYLIKKNNNN